MDEFEIRSECGGSSLIFFEREPFDADLPLLCFSVRVSAQGLSAVMSVHTAYVPWDPAVFFAEMAERWKGWEGELVHESWEEEFELRCGQDQSGHVSIGIELRKTWGDCWSVKSTVTTEAGQLEGLARRAKRFFGRAGP